MDIVKELGLTKTTYIHSDVENPFECYSVPNTNYKAFMDKEYFYFFINFDNVQFIELSKVTKDIFK